MNKKVLGIIFLLLAQFALFLDGKKITYLRNYFFLDKKQIVDNQNNSKKIPQNIKQLAREDTESKFEKIWLNGSIPPPDDYLQFSKVILQATCLQEKFNMSDEVVDKYIEDEISRKDLDMNEAILFFRKKNLKSYLVLFSDYLDENNCKFASDDSILLTNKIKFKLSLVEDNNDWEEINIKNDEGNEKFFIDKKSFKINNQFVEANLFSVEFGSNGNLKSYRDDQYIFNCKKQTVKTGISGLETNYKLASKDIGNYFCKKYISENASNHEWVTYKSDDSTQVDMKSLIKTNDGWIRGNLRWLYKDGNGSPARSFEMKCKDDIQFLDSFLPTLRYFKVGQEWWFNYEIEEGTRYQSYLSDSRNEVYMKNKQTNDSKINMLYQFICTQ